MNKLEVNYKFGIVDYVELVNNLVSEYYDERGEYTPHYGRLNAMRLFYNNCVKTDLFDLPHTITDAMDMEKLIDCDEFLQAFDEAIVGQFYEEKGYNGFSGFTFGDAYRDATDIVNNRNSSLNYAVTAIGNKLNDLLVSVSSLLSDEKIEKLEKLAGYVTDGSAVNFESILQRAKQGVNQ